MLTLQQTYAPELSVITVALNEDERIGKAFKSLDNQTFRNFEHIIVDGGSKDGTLQKVEAHVGSASYPVRVLRDVSGGVYDALNEGISVSKGKYIAILHANDTFASAQSLDVAMHHLKDNNADLLYADLHFVNSAGKRVRYYSAKRFSPERLKDGFMPPHPTLIVSRKIFDVVGMYNQHYGIAGDFDWLCRALLLHRVSYTYLPIDMVEMSSGGISGRLLNRLWFSNREKYMSLRSNGFRVSPLRLLKRYLFL